MCYRPPRFCAIMLPKTTQTSSRSALDSDLEGMDKGTYDFALRFNEGVCGGNSPSNLLNRHRVVSGARTIFWYEPSEEQFTTKVQWQGQQIAFFAIAGMLLPCFAFVVKYIHCGFWKLLNYRQHIDASFLNLFLQIFIIGLQEQKNRVTGIMYIPPGGENS
jgi:hypothetical protein